jgi:osmotically-inducible protein OsmY
VVSLAGVVASKADRDLALRVAQDVRGVREVDADGLTVG